MTTPSSLNRELITVWRQPLQHQTKACVWLLAFIIAALWTGCAAAPSTPARKPSVVSEVALVGKVVMVNSTARFVVLTFPLGQLPAIDQRLDVYRDGLKVGEVKVSAWQREDSVVGDITVGDCQTGDKAWAK